MPSSIAKEEGKETGRPDEHGPLKVFLYLLVIFSFLYVWGTGARSYGPDFYQFWLIGKTAGHGKAVNIYSDAERARIGREAYERAQAGGSSAVEKQAAEERQFIETYSTPFLYMNFKIFGFLKYDLAFAVYKLLLMTCGFAALWILCRLFGYSRESSLLAVALLSACFTPFLLDVRNANVNAFQLLDLALFLLVGRSRIKNRDIWAGAVLGISFMFKPNLIYAGLLLGLVWLFNRRFRKLLLTGVGAGAAVIFCFAVSSAFFGSAEIWIQWMETLRSIPQNIISVDRGNFSPDLIFFGRAQETASRLMTVVFLGAAVMAMWIGRRRAIPARDIPAPESDEKRAFLETSLAVSSGCLIYLLSSNLVWMHYYMLAVPMILLAFAPEFDRAARKRSGVAVRRFIAAVAWFLLAMNPVKNLLDLQGGIVLPAACFAGCALLLGCALWGFSIQERPSRSITN